MLLSRIRKNAETNTAIVSDKKIDRYEVELAERRGMRLGKIIGIESLESKLLNRIDDDVIKQTVTNTAAALKEDIEYMEG